MSEDHQIWAYILYGQSLNLLKSCEIYNLFVFQTRIVLSLAWLVIQGYLFVILQSKTIDLKCYWLVIFLRGIYFCFDAFYSNFAYFDAGGKK